jgi:hypothetical protein
MQVVPDVIPWLDTHDRQLAEFSGMDDLEKIGVRVRQFFDVHRPAVHVPPSFTLDLPSKRPRPRYERPTSLLGIPRGRPDKFGWSFFGF